jgi:hypothetical protein
MSVVNPSGALALDTKDFSRSLNRAASIFHITTYDVLQTCDIKDTLKVVERNEYKSLDFIVVEEGPSVVGLLERRAKRHVDSKLIGEIYTPTSERNIISEKAGVLEFLLNATSSPARLVLSNDKIKVRDV